MPTVQEQIRSILIILLPLTAVVIAFLWMWGISLRDAPRRRVELGMTELVIGFVLTFGGMFVAQYMFLSSVGAIGVDPETGERVVSLEALTPRSMALLGMCSQLGMMLPVVLFLAWRWRGQAGNWRRFGVVPRHPMREIGYGLAGLGIALVLVFTVANIALLIYRVVSGEPPDKIGHEMLRYIIEARGATLAMFLISAVLFAPLFEEFVYRGFLQTALLGVARSMRVAPVAGHWMAIGLAASLFMAMHAQSVPWYNLPGLFMIGLVNGWLYERTGSLLPPTILHVAFNALNVALALTSEQLAPVSS